MSTELQHQIEQLQTMESSSSELSAQLIGHIKTGIQARMDDLLSGKSILIGSATLFDHQTQDSQEINRLLASMPNIADSLNTLFEQYQIPLQASSRGTGTMVGLAIHSTVEQQPVLGQDNQKLLSDDQNTTIEGTLVQERPTVEAVLSNVTDQLATHIGSSTFFRGAEDLVYEASREAVQRDLHSAIANLSLENPSVVIEGVFAAQNQLTFIEEFVKWLSSNIRTNSNRIITITRMSSGEVHLTVQRKKLQELFNQRVQAFDAAHPKTQLEQQEPEEVKVEQHTGHSEEILDKSVTLEKTVDSLQLSEWYNAAHAEVQATVRSLWNVSQIVPELQSRVADELPRLQRAVADGRTYIFRDKIPNGILTEEKIRMLREATNDGKLVVTGGGLEQEVNVTLVPISYQEQQQPETTAQEPTVPENSQRSELLAAISKKRIDQVIAELQAAALKSRRSEQTGGEAQLVLTHLEMTPFIKALGITPAEQEATGYDHNTEANAYKALPETRLQLEASLGPELYAAISDALDEFESNYLRVAPLRQSRTISEADNYLRELQQDAPLCIYSSANTVTTYTVREVLNNLGICRTYIDQKAQGTLQLEDANHIYEVANPLIRNMISLVERRTDELRQSMETERKTGQLPVKTEARPHFVKDFAAYLVADVELQYPGMDAYYNQSTTKTRLDQFSKNVAGAFETGDGDRVFAIYVELLNELEQNNVRIIRKGSKANTQNPSPRDLINVLNRYRSRDSLFDERAQVDKQTRMLGIRTVLTTIRSGGSFDDFVDKYRQSVSQTTSTKSTTSGGWINPFAGWFGK